MNCLESVHPCGPFANSGVLPFAIDALPHDGSFAEGGDSQAIDNAVVGKRDLLIGSHPGRQPIVRVIDDDPEMRKSLKWVFETATLAVDVYASFAEFQARNDPRTPGCLVLDLKLKDEDGLQVMEQLSRQPESHLPVIILTGHGDVLAAVQCMKLGAIDFFQKPMSSDALIARVREAIDLHIRRCRESETIDEARRRIQLLSPAEREMVDLISQGLSSKQIAIKLGLSIKTVVNRRARAMVKVNAVNAPELVRIVTDGKLGQPTD